MGDCRDRAPAICCWASSERRVARYGGTASSTRTISPAAALSIQYSARVDTGWPSFRPAWSAAGQTRQRDQRSGSWRTSGKWCAGIPRSVLHQPSDRTACGSACQHAPGDRSDERARLRAGPRTSIGEAALGDPRAPSLARLRPPSRSVAHDHDGVVAVCGSSTGVRLPAASHCRGRATSLSGERESRGVAPSGRATVGA